MATTRHGLYGGARAPYGSFAGKETVLTDFLSIRERILRNIESTLDSIKVANGYDHDLRSVIRVEDPWDGLLEGYPAVTMREAPVEEDALLSALDHVTGTLVVDLGLWVRDHADAPAALNALLMDVERALHVDTTRGGLAIDTRLASNTTFFGDATAPLGQIVLRVEVPWRHDFGDPFAQGGVRGEGFGSFPAIPPAKAHALSVRERIVRDVTATLEGITAGNGFRNTVVQVTRTPSRPDSLEGFPAFVVSEVSERKRHGGAGAPAGVIACELELAVTAWERRVEDQEEVARQLNELLADAKKALLADVTRSGLAIRTAVPGNAAESAETGAPWGANVLRVVVRYRHAHGDPSKDL